MNAWSRHRWYAEPVTSALLGISCLALSALAGGGGSLPALSAAGETVTLRGELCAVS